jgi:hypothetical protein
VPRYPWCAASTAAPRLGVRPHRRFSNRGAEYLSESGMQWTRGGAKRHGDRARPPPSGSYPHMDKWTRGGAQRRCGRALCLAAAAAAAPRPGRRSPRPSAGCCRSPPRGSGRRQPPAAATPPPGGRLTAPPAGLAQGESAIKYKSPLNVLKDTYERSCCLAR